MPLIGIGLAAGRGERAYPMSKKSQDYIRSKAVIPFLGKSTIMWVLDEFNAQGITDYHIIVKGEENYDQIKRAVGHGEQRGLRIGYSRVDDDNTNTGSGDSLLTNLERFNITDPAFVFPMDNIYDIDLQAMHEFHKARKAVLTITGFDCDARDMLGKYGFIQWNSDNVVTGFGEKPADFEAIAKNYPEIATEDIPNLTLVASGGAYMINSKKLREIAGSDALTEMRKNKLDIGGHLVPWLVKEGYPVLVFRIPKFGDLGTPHDYLDTMESCLAGEFESIEKVGLGHVFDTEKRLFIDKTTLKMKDGRTGTTLAKKLENGDVVLGKNVRIGRDVEIYPGVVLDNCNVSDDSTLFDGAEIARSELHERCSIGESASVNDSIIGTNSMIRSSKKNPTKLEHFVFVGDASDIGEGSQIYDNCTIPPKGKTQPGTKMIRGKIKA